jgi:hypothetical protein
MSGYWRASFHGNGWQQMVLGEMARHFVGIRRFRGSRLASSGCLLADLIVEHPNNKKAADIVSGLQSAVLNRTISRPS